MAEPDIPPQVQEQVDQLQAAQNQLGLIQQQRQQIEYQAREVQRASEELTSLADDAPVYRTIGGILFKTGGKTEVLAKLAEEKESLEVRLQGFQKREGRIKEEATELQSKVRAALANLPAFQNQGTN